MLQNDIEMRDELSVFCESLKSAPDTERFFGSPSFSLEDKRRFLQKIYQKRADQVQTTLVNFLTILLEKSRFGLIHEMSDCFKQIVDERHGMGVAELKSAVPLSPEVEREIVKALEKIAGYKITIKKEVDPSLIGGISVKIRNKVLDGSISHQLDLIKKELTKIGSL